MWHFMSTFVDLVLPKIKDWKGIKARGGDRNGNFSIGLSPTIVELWPEIAVNYDSYVNFLFPFAHPLSLIPFPLSGKRFSICQNHMLETKADFSCVCFFYDWRRYPPNMVTGVNVTLTTSATNDQDGQKLLAALGIPFDPSGK